jgi:methyl-accepting chemotaxis protein
MELLTKQTLSRKIVGLIVLAILVLSATIFSATYFLIYRNIVDQAKKNLLSDGNLVEAQIDFLKAKLAMVASLMANNAAVVAAIKNKNSDFLRQYSQETMKAAGGIFVTIADNEGKVIARGHSLEAGDNVLNQVNIKKALVGEISAGIEEGTVVKFSLRAGHPVKVGDQVVGSITTGINLSSDHSFVDEMKIYHLS